MSREGPPDEGRNSRVDDHVSLHRLLGSQQNWRSISWQLWAMLAAQWRPVIDIVWETHRANTCQEKYIFRETVLTQQFPKSARPQTLLHWHLPDRGSPLPALSRFELSWRVFDSSTTQVGIPGSKAMIAGFSGLFISRFQPALTFLSARRSALMLDDARCGWKFGSRKLT